MISCHSQAQNDNNAAESKYLKAVEIFASNILEEGKDTYGEMHSPLFADGIHIQTKEPVRWQTKNDSWIISNFASQQNLMRVFVGLSALTGDPQYEEAAKSTVQYMFDNYSDEAGLLYWGGHQFADLQSMENQFKNRPHELKNNYPFYEFMWKVDSTSTRKMLHAIWNAHILDWEVLDLNRHGEYGLPLGKLWEHEFKKPPPFFESEGLTFINAGTDMMQAAFSLYILGNEVGARTWGVRLFEQYEQARHPQTNLGVYQYSKPKRNQDPPKVGPLTGELTFSGYGDRAQNQFGQKYGDIALEGNVLWGGRMGTLYGRSPVMLLYLAEQLKENEAGKILLNGTVSSLKAYAQYGYDPDANMYKPMWADGTDLSGEKIPRTGYFGTEGTKFKPIEPTGEMMFALSKAIRLTGGDKVLWETLRHQFIGNNLGDPGEKWNKNPNLNFQTEVADAAKLATVLEIYKAFKQPDFLKLAERIGDNILEEKFYKGYFIKSKKHKYVRFDIPEPLVLLMLEEVRQGREGEVPVYLTGEGSTDGEPSIDGRPSDESYYHEKF